jgi:BolA protein
MILQPIIEKKLKEKFEPVHMEIVNESYKHNVPAEAEYHFKVVLVAKSFEGQGLIQRHRAVNEVLKEELVEALHALSLHTYTPEEWAKKQPSTQTPDCLGGHK